MTLDKQRLIDGMREALQSYSDYRTGADGSGRPSLWECEQIKARTDELETWLALVERGDYDLKS